MKKHTSRTTKSAKTKNKSTNPLKISTTDLLIMRPDVAGIDIGAKEIMVAAPCEDSILVRSFGTTTPQLREMAKWLNELNVSAAAMEATGIYWIAPCEVLQDAGIEAVVVDAKKVKNLPGKKTDVKDCQWIQILFSRGLLQAAFRPPKKKEGLRAYVRHRDNLIQERQTAIMMMDKSLLLMNIKLDVVLSKITNETGLQMIRAIVKGERNPYKITKFRHSQCHHSEAEFVDALTGNYQDTHLFSLRQGLESYDHVNEQLLKCESKIHDELQNWETIKDTPLPKKEKQKRGQYADFKMADLLYQKTGFDLTLINGISDHTATIIVSELGGLDFKTFKTCKAFCSWLGVCPGNNISGGKRMGGQSRKVKNRVKQALQMCGNNLRRSDNALGAYARRMCGRLGPAKGIKAVAHKLARLIYYLCTQGKEYVEQGQAAYEVMYREKYIKAATKKLKAMGYEVRAKNEVELVLKT